MSFKKLKSKLMTSNPMKMTSSESTPEVMKSMPTKPVSNPSSKFNGLKRELAQKRNLFKRTKL